MFAYARLQEKCQFSGFWDAAKFTVGTWVTSDGSTYVGKFEDGPTGAGCARPPSLFCCRPACVPPMP